MHLFFSAEATMFEYLLLFYCGFIFYHVVFLAYVEYFLIRSCALSSATPKPSQSRIISLSEAKESEHNVNSLGFTVSNHKMAALLHSLPTQGRIVTLIIPFYSLSNQPIYWDKTKRERKTITLFHPHPCLINLSALDKQANGSVGGSAGNKTNDQLLLLKTPCSHRSQLSFICFYPAAGCLKSFVPHVNI